MCVCVCVSPQKCNFPIQIVLAAYGEDVAYHRLRLEGHVTGQQQCYEVLLPSRLQQLLSMCVVKVLL
jgi:hypothetical protein